MANVSSPLCTQSELKIRGVSDWTRDLCEKIARYAPYKSSVLITGPSGTGKELIARSLHSASPRVTERFVPIDCAAVTGELMASQLFGHLEGAFTGANHASLGCFRAADKGTIFLDEIGELELPLQAKLLRVLQERVVVPVGGHDGIPVDVRVVAATNRDLVEEVRAGRFREDLFFRLNVVSLPTKALADRPEDIPPLAVGFLDQLVQEGMPEKGISAETLCELQKFSWPGNVRQLKNFLEQAVINCDGPRISLPDVRSLLENGIGILSCSTDSEEQLTDASLEKFEIETAGENSLNDTLNRSQRCEECEWITLESLERQYLIQTLEHTYYNRAAASRLLGISRQSLLRKIAKHGIEIPTTRTS